MQRPGFWEDSEQAALTSAAHAAAWARGWLERTGKCRNATRSSSSFRGASSAAQNGHS